MLLDVPNGDEFKTSGCDFLNIAWETLTKLLKQLKDAQDYYEEWLAPYDEDESDSISVDQYWQKSQRSLSTALSLIQQGTEFLLKGNIAKISPYLLLAGGTNSYPRKSDKRDVSFSEFKTVDAQDLIRIYNTVSTDRLPESFQRQFEKSRSKRNTIMHTVDPNLSIEIKELFTEILMVHYHLSGTKNWIETRKLFIENSPHSELWTKQHLEYNFTINQLASEINLVAELLKAPENKMFFGLEKKQRRYICPNCDRIAFRGTYRQAGTYSDIPRLAQLSPNEPTSQSVHCVVCGVTSEVIREDCTYDGCLGNVIEDGYYTCLTCGNES